MTVKLDDLKRAHHTLMVEYVNILNYVSKLPFSVDSFQERVAFSQENAHTKKSQIKAGKLSSRERYGLRFLIRLFVESHIKEKLSLLEASYVQLAQAFETAIDEPSNTKYQIWLKQAEEASAKFANSLSSWHSIRGLVSALWPVVVGFLVAKLGVNDIYQAILEVELPPIGTLVVVLFFVVPYFLIFIHSAFTYKRKLFWGQPQETAKNVYQIEDRLFNLLEKGKTHEFPIDIVTFPILPFILGGVGIWMGFMLDIGGYPIGLITFLKIICVFGGIWFVLEGIMRVGKEIRKKRSVEFFEQLPPEM